MFMIQSSDFSHIFDCDLEQKQTGVKMSGKGQEYPHNSCDIKRTHSSTRANVFERRLCGCHFRNIITFFVPKHY